MSERNEEVECIDLVNADGIVVQRGVLRDDYIREEGLYMRIVIAVITNSAGLVLAHKRAAVKSHPGLMDHVCGGVRANEDPLLDAVPRETREEVGITIHEVEEVRSGLNEYGRFCILVRGKSDEMPNNLNPLEVESADYHPLHELYAKRDSGEMEFVNGFFEDVEATLKFSGT